MRSVRLKDLQRLLKERESKEQYVENIQHCRAAGGNSYGY